MKIVFDTNVLISAFIATGSSKDVLEFVIENHEVFLSRYIFNELKDKLLNKLGFSLEEYKEIEDILISSVNIASDKQIIFHDFTDKKDLPILNLCISVNADLLITGDKKVRSLGKIGETKIISPSEYWAIEKNEQMKIIKGEHNAS